ncbi:30S ribosomal protein S4 [bacterium]|nr:30S ribosomal protein S4 [bacterium]|tara:strand:+ start:8167 stop:8787 length:621 start_codon:yes stop_codon:yes gene_type:complete
MKNAKCRQCRSAGEKLFLKGDRCFSVKCSIIKRNYGPGLHGQARKRMPSEYGVRLKEKQKMRRIYNISEKQFRKYFRKANQKQENTGSALVQILETRLDNVIFRSGLAKSRSQARQMTTHSFFKINNRKIDIPSFSVKPGDLIEIKQNKKNTVLIQDLKENLKSAKPASWLNFDKKQLNIKILNLPIPEQIDHKVNLQLVVEYYSK